jgi:CheY-like chemotaxis protein
MDMVRRNETVLVVEDDVDCAEAISTTLNVGAFVRVLHADGAAALGWLARSPPPALILLDLDLPTMTGAELARAYAQLGVPLAPIVIFSAHRPEEGDDGVRAVARLRKPVDVAELLAIVVRHARGEPSAPS